jgi:hypothetical protein
MGEVASKGDQPSNTLSDPAFASIGTNVELIEPFESSFGPILAQSSTGLEKSNEWTRIAHYRAMIAHAGLARSWWKAEEPRYASE